MRLERLAVFAAILAWAVTFIGGAAAAEPLQRVRVSDDKTRFVLVDSGKTFTPWGFNYDHDGPGRLIEDYWHDEWPAIEQDFAEMKSLGANVIRVHLQFGKFIPKPGEPDQRELGRLRDLLKLADRTGLYLDITGLGSYHKQDVPAWYDALDEAGRWQAQAEFWETIAAACKSSPAVFCYDLMNEPVIGGNPKEQGWLTGELGGKFFVQRLTLTPGDRKPHQIAKAWVEQMVAAIRKHDQQGLITVGVIPWALVFRGAKPLFYSPEVGEKLDFASVHFYPEKGKIDEAIAALAVYDVGKPLVIEETFPLKAGGEEFIDFIKRSRTHADGWISFYWGTTLEEYKNSGEFKDALVGGMIETFIKTREIVKPTP